MAFPIEKLKRKSNLYQTPTDSILTFLGIRPLSFEFVVDLPLSECKERLESQRKERGLWGWVFGASEITVEAWRLAGDTYEFNLLKKQSKHPDVVIQGILTQISSYTSLVSGQARNPYSIFSIFYTLALLIFITVVWSSMSVQLAPIPALWFALSWPLGAWFNKRDRDRVRERFEDAFTSGNFAPAKRKRSS
ncbi:MAG TPA: hypothetical protein VKQ72_23720 [Aggregatilineales bacterium]|nr:hypothetical protein [Aggregatilineales bacterium]